MIYNITVYNTNGEIVYKVLANTQQQMIQEIKDATTDGNPVLVCPIEKQGE